MDRTESFSRKLIDLIESEVPEALDLDAEAGAMVATVLAAHIGAILAGVCVREGEASYLVCLGKISKHIHDTAMGTIAEAIKQRNMQ
jgi:hypothetical protein